MSVIDHIKSHFSPEYISELGIELGESESSISKAIKGLIPLVMNGLANLAEHSNVLNFVYHSHSGINNETEFSNIKELFLNDNPALLTSIQDYSKISETSIKNLFDKVLEKSLIAFSKDCAEKNIEPSKITNFLKEQKGLIPGILPAGLSSETLGLKEKAPTQTEITTDASNSNKTASKPVEISKGNIPKKNKKSFWTWLLPLLFIGLASWFLSIEYLKQLNAPRQQPKPLIKVVKKDSIVQPKKDSTKINDTIKVNNTIKK